MKTITKFIPFILCVLMACQEPTPDPTPTTNPIPNPTTDPVANPAPGPTRRPEVTVTTVAGFYTEDSHGGFQDGKGQAAAFKYPGQMVFDKFDNLYIIDQAPFGENATTIRKMDPVGNVTTFATGFVSLADICIDPRDGITLYAVDNAYYSETKVCAIYKITAAGEKIKIGGGPDRIGYQDGSLEQTRFSLPSGCVMDSSGNIYIADAGNYCVRKINLNSGMVTTLAGHPFDINTTCRYTDATGMAAEFCNFTDLTIDLEGSIIVPDRYNHSMRKITTAGQVSTFIESGGGLEIDGPLAQARATFPLRACYDMQRKILYMSSHSGGKLRVVTREGMVYSLAGRPGNTFDHGYRDGDGQTAKFNGMHGLAVNLKGDIFIADHMNHCIRKVTLNWQ